MMTCGSYCSHGGICVLPNGHAGLHDSKYCTWGDEESLTEEQADAKLAQLPYGRAYLGLKSALAPLVGDEAL